MRRSKAVPSGECDPTLGGPDRRSPDVIRGLPSMQRLANFADRKERAGSRFFDFQLLILVGFDKADQTIQDRQRLLRRLTFGKLQGP